MFRVPSSFDRPVAFTRGGLQLLVTSTRCLS